MCLLNPGVDPPESVFSLFFFLLTLVLTIFSYFPKWNHLKLYYKIAGEHFFPRMSTQATGHSTVVLVKLLTPAFAFSESVRPVVGSIC